MVVDRQLVAGDVMVVNFRTTIYWSVLATIWGVDALRLATFVLMCLLVGLFSSVDGEAKEINVRGSPNCAQWANARNDKFPSEHRWYLVGVLNGLALGSGTEFWSRSGHQISNEQAFYWMDIYCQKNPLGDLTTGAILLMKERSDEEYTRRLEAQKD